MAAGLMSGPLFAESQGLPVARGEIFLEERCQNCHAVKDDDGNYLAGGDYSVRGPNLFNVVGRPAASVEGFEYSEAMIRAREAGLVWTVEALDRFLIDPTLFVRELLGDNKIRPNMGERVSADEIRGALLHDLVAFSPDTATSDDFAAVRALAPETREGTADSVGATLFRTQNCVRCHVVQDPEGNLLAGQTGRSGPNLYGVIGRPAASADGFEYRDELVAARDAGLVWTEENVAEFLKYPGGFLRDFLGDRTANATMGARIEDEQVRATLAAFLAGFGPGTTE